MGKLNISIRIESEEPKRAYDEVPIGDGFIIVDKNHLPRDWSDEIKNAWFRTNDELIWFAISPYRGKYRNGEYSDILLEDEELHSIGMNVAWESIEKFEYTGDRLSTYIVNNIRNRIKDYVEKYNGAEKRKATVLPYDTKPDSDDGLAGYDNVVLDQVNSLRDPDKTAHEIVEDNAEKEVLYRAIKTILTPEERYVIIWNDLEEMSQKDIAEQLDCSQAKVSDIREMALKKLHREMYRKGYEE